MRKILERYLEAKRLLSETTATLKDHSSETLKDGAREVAEEAVRVAEEQLVAALHDHGLPSKEIKITKTMNNQHLFNNKALAQQYVQEAANREREGKFLVWNHGEVLRALPHRDEGPMTPPRRHPDHDNPMRGM